MLPLCALQFTLEREGDSGTQLHQTFVKQARDPFHAPKKKCDAKLWSCPRAFQNTVLPDLQHYLGILTYQAVLTAPDTAQIRGA